ncbi:hypothetical protein K439DRAFT_638557 [Ramaria rubella]|nr:hypothetical protein K439DRAFT_638557 [Ramaria rubella]
MSALGPQIPAHLAKSAQVVHDDDDSDDEYGPVPPPPPPTAGPQLPPHLASKPPADNDDDDEDDEDAYTPALPPDLPAPRRTLAPSLPTQRPHVHANAPTRPAPRTSGYTSSDSDEVGPMPLPPGAQASNGDDAVREFEAREERRRKAAEEARAPKKLEREEWMLVPPSSTGVLGSLDPTKLKARQFSRSAAPAARTQDSSLWTETPAQRQARIKDEVDGKRRRATDVADEDADEARDDRKRRKHEADVKAQVDEYNRQTRSHSLVDMHKSAAAKAKEDGEDDGGPPVIWDHARDMSVGGRLMDEGQRSKMITEARGLGDRFGKGKSGGFL